MFAYCGNNPVMNVDYTGEKVIAIELGFSLYLIGGLSYSISLVVDDSRNIGIQVTEANIINNSSGAVIGGAGISAGITGKVSTAETIHDLTVEGLTISGLNVGQSSFSFSPDLESSSFDVSNIEISNFLGFSVSAIPWLPTATMSKTNTLGYFNLDETINTLFEKVKSWF